MAISFFLRAYELGLLLGICIIFSSCLSPDPTITIEAGDYYRSGTPISFNYTSKLNYDIIGLTNTENGSQTVAQKKGDNTWVFILDEPLDPNQNRKYQILETPIKFASIVRAQTSEENVHFSIGDKQVMTYHIAIQEPPEDSPAYYLRSGFIHPLKSPGGQTLTDGFPKHHMHQHGIFFAWTNTSFQGKKIDFWNQQDQLGTVVHDTLISTEWGPVFSQMKVGHKHLAFPNGDTTIVLKETWEIMLYNREDYFIWDITSKMVCQTDSPLHILKYDYGGMAFRGHASWDDPEPKKGLEAYGPGQGRFLSSEGRTRINGNHTRPKWASLYGEVDGETAGFAVLSHPNNFRFPQPVRIHPEMPYFVFAPEVEGPFDLKKGEEYVSRYRIISFQGEPDTEKLDQMWQDYGIPVSMINN